MEMFKPEVLISQEEIAERIDELGRTISNDFATEDLVVICVLKGAFMFCSDLIKKINRPCALEFISLSSYGAGMESTGEVKLLMDVSGTIKNKNVLIVEDIVDSGLTIKFLMNHLQSKNPKTIRLASLLHKPTKTKFSTKIDYLAFEIEDKFVIGYGLDYAGRFRELPYIGVLNAGN